MFGLNLKLVLGVAVLAVIGGLITVQHFTAKRLNAATARANQAEANYTALQEAQKHERKIANDALKDRDQRLADLETARSTTPTRVVRLCRQADSSVSATTGTSDGVDAADSSGREGQDGRDIEAGPDIGAEIYALMDRKDEEAAQCNALQGWVRAR